MQFRLVHTEVPYCRLNKLKPHDGDEQASLDNAYKLRLDIFPDSTRPEMFGVIFQLELTHHFEFKLKLEYLAWFENSEPLTEEDLRSSFAYINAPAIAFPFMRSFVSFLTLNAGYKPAILPTVNFIQMYEQAKEKKKA